MALARHSHSELYCDIPKQRPWANVPGHSTHGIPDFNTLNQSPSSLYKDESSQIWVHIRAFRSLYLLFNRGYVVTEPSDIGYSQWPQPHRLLVRSSPPRSTFNGCSSWRRKGNTSYIPCNSRVLTPVPLSCMLSKKRTGILSPPSPGTIPAHISKTL